MKWVIGFVLATGIAAFALHRLGYNLVIGGLILNEASLQKMKERGERKSQIVVGGCVISPNVDVELMAEVIPRFLGLGGLVAPKAMPETYGPRLKFIGGTTYR